MRFTNVFVLAAAAGMATAAPASEQQQLEQLRNTNRIQQVEAGRKLPGPLALAAAYAKYNKTMPTPVVRAAAQAAAATTVQSGTVQATNLPYDKAYLSNVTVGKRSFRLDFDTGSSDLWVFSTLQPAAQQKNHQVYGLGGTRLSGETWDISYGDGSGASGAVYADRVIVGGVTATVQAVEAATSVSSSFQSNPGDGLLGLGFGIGNTCYPNQCYTFMQQVTPTLPKPIFTATLRHNAPGTYDFGFLDSSKYTGAITYFNLTGTQGGSFWEFTSGGFAINKGPKQVRSMDCIADTGTSLALVDQAVVNAFYAPVTGAAYNSNYGGVVFPCSSASKLPSLSFYMGGTNHTMPGSYGLYLAIGGGTNLCYGGVQANTNIGFTILGDVFLKSQYVVFNTHIPNLGFAQQRGVVV